MARQSPAWKHRGDVSGQGGLTPDIPSLIQVTCYHKAGRGTDRALVFRVQFHTCTIHGPRLTFPKDQLDEAWAGVLETDVGAGAQGRGMGGQVRGAVAWLLTAHSPQMRGSPSKPRWSSSSPPALRRSKVRAKPWARAKGCLPVPQHLGGPVHRQHPTE